MMPKTRWRLSKVTSPEKWMEDAARCSVFTVSWTRDSCDELLRIGNNELIRYDILGCGFPVSYQFVYTISADICGEAYKLGLARQRREFKTFRKSTAQMISLPRCTYQ